MYLIKMAVMENDEPNWKGFLGESAYPYEFESRHDADAYLQTFLDRTDKDILADEQFEGLFDTGEDEDENQYRVSGFEIFELVSVRKETRG